MCKLVELSINIVSFLLFGICIPHTFHCYYACCHQIVGLIKRCCFVRLSISLSVCPITLVQKLHFTAVVTLKYEIQLR